MNEKLYHKAQLIQQNDLVYITNNTNTFNKMERVSYIGHNTFTTKSELVFSKSTLQCITKNRAILFIEDIYLILFRRVLQFFYNKNFSNQIKIDNDIILSRKYKNSIVDVVIVKSNKDYCKICITCNDIIIFAGDIYEESDLDIIYKCVIKKLE